MITRWQDSGFLLGFFLFPALGGHLDFCSVPLAILIMPVITICFSLLHKYAGHRVVVSGNGSG